MKKNNRQWVKAILLPAVVSGALTLTAASGILDAADLSLSDRWYQSRSASDGKIVLVGIDQRALEEIGPYSQWGRDVAAMALEALNASEDCRPAVIAVDVLYAGETDPEADAWLAEAAGRYGNVLTACAAEYGEALVEDRPGEYRLDTFALTAFEEPYEALQTVTRQGHINAMLDTDGVLRHHLLDMELPDGTRVPSMALAAAQMYREAVGEEPVDLPPVDARGFWYVPFCGIPGDFDESISVADLLSGAIGADYFADKIVLIGPYAAGLQDSYVTSADHARAMYGIEYQANAIQALLREDYRLEADEGLQLMLLFLVLLLGGICFFRLPVRLSTPVWAVLLGGSLWGSRMAYESGYVLHVLWIPAGLTFLYVGSIAVHYVRAALEKRRVTDTFKRYVAPEIVNEILKEGLNPLELTEGRNRRVAVLFVDVRGFTTMSEQLEAKEVVEILNEYLTLISDCILRNGGTLDKFVGDAAMAFWGAPLPQEDYVMHALQAAWDMVEGSRRLSEKLAEAHDGRTVSFGIGVHVGEAVIGNIGSPQRMDYTAIGDTVNTAARLEANAPAGTIYISRAVADELKGRIQATSLGDTIRLKGKKEGFEVLTLDRICERSGSDET